MSSKQFEIKIGVNSGGVVTGINSAIGQINRLGSAFKTGLGAVGIAASVAGIIAMIKAGFMSLVQWGAGIQKTARENGIGVESFQEIAAAAKETSVEVTEATTAFKKLQLAQVGAIKGNVELQQAFARQGISLATLKSMTPLALFKAIGESFEKAAPSAQLTADAMALMGKNSDKMLGAMRGGFISAMRDAEALGEVLDEKTIKSLVRVDDALARFALQAKVYFAKMLPPVIEFTAQVIDAAHATGIWLKTWAKAGGPGEASVKAADQAVDKFFSDKTEKAKKDAKFDSAKPAGALDASNVISNANGNTLAKPDSDKLLSIGGYRGGGEIARIPAQQLRVQQRMEQHLGRIAHYAEGSFASRTNDPELKALLYKVDRFFNGGFDLE